MKTPPAPARTVPLVTGARVPLAFIAGGLVFWMIATAWLAARPELPGLPYAHPALVTLAHLWLPGFLVSICIGVIYQMAPVVLGTPLAAPPGLLWLHLGLHFGGTTGLVLGLGNSRYGLAAAAGSAVTAGTLLLALAVGRTFAASRRRDAVASCFPFAATWLALTAVAGVTVALNRRAPWLPLAVTDLLRAHAHLGLAGFFLTLLQGATFQLVPMFTLAEIRRPRWIAGGLLATQFGLAGLAPSLAFGTPRAAMGCALLIALGVGASGAAFGATLRARRRRPLEPGVRAFVGGAILLGAAAAAAVPLARPDGAALAPGVYGVLLIAGALGLAVLGMLGKIVPFLVWMRAYGPRAGRQPVPAATALGSAQLERVWLAAHLAGVAGLLVGLQAGEPAWLAAGAALLAGAAASQLLNMGLVMKHLFRPARGAVVP